MKRIVSTSVGLVLSFFDTIWVSEMRDSTLIYTSMIWVFDSIFNFQYHLGLYTMQGPSYLGKITLVSICFRMVVTQIITWV